MHAQCFSKWGYPGRREKVTKQGVRTPWKKGCSNALFVCSFCDFWVPLGSFCIPGATYFGSFFVNFFGGSPGSFLDAFWLLFGCLLVSFWSPFGCLSFGCLGDIFGRLCFNFGRLDTFVGLWTFGESLASFFDIFVNNLKMCFPVLC